ncbi:MAG: hypothetical protein JSS09_07190, partial [Verrucomicrobia bacterium]|nr:hypothetical protein [Verrucomicrobiota bacterium]
LDRDAETDPVPSLDGAEPYVYSENIRTVINAPLQSNATVQHRKADRRCRLLMPAFQRKDSPLHGAPAP